MSRVLLINPPKEVPLLDLTLRYPPLGLMSIAAALPGHEVDILDMKAEKTRRDDLKASMAHVDILGVTALTTSVDSGLQLCRTAKEHGVMTVMGGVHPSLMPQVAANPEVDVAVRGEGEITFREIAEGKPIGSIAGISYMDGGYVVHNPDRPPADLESLPPPRRDLIRKYTNRYEAFGRSLGALSTARGCPYNCSFCCVPRVWRGYRQLSAGSVVDEIRRMERTDIVGIVDDNFCHDMKRVEEVCDLISLEGLNDRLYSVFSRVDSIVRHPGVVEKMAEANMRVVIIGIEAATQTALDRMKKKTTLGDIHRACEILEKNGILIWAGHIIGNMEDTYEDVASLIAMSKRLPLDIAQFTVITPYPGTDLYETAVENELIEEYDFTEYCECEPPMHTPRLSRIELMELEIKAYMEFYGIRAMLKRSIRWFRNRDKRWVFKDNYSGFSSFWKYRNRSASYFLRTYKKVVRETEGAAGRVRTPLVSTPGLYSISSGFFAALITLSLTILAGPVYGDYSSLPLLFIISDLLFAALLVASVTAAAAAWLGILYYRKGWIFSVRRRRPVKRKRSRAGRVLRNTITFSAAAFTAAAITVFIFTISGLSHMLDYGFKEIAVTLIAFLAASISAYVSIQAARNGEPVDGARSSAAA